MKLDSFRLSEGSGAITACSLHHDTSRTFATKDANADGAADAVCVVCRSTLLEILSLPSMEVLLSVNDISDGQRVVPSTGSAGATPLLSDLYLLCVSG